MGDQLDDFFAKKDKKKKSKSSFKAIDILEEPTKDKKEKKKKETDRQHPIKTESATDNGDEEWKEATEEVVPDYSGLRIKTLTIEDQTEEQDENGDCDENESNKGGMFWNKLEGDPSIAPPSLEDEQKEIDWATATDTHQSNSVLSGKYVPPSMRNSGSTQNPTPLRKKNWKNQAPNLTSVEDFPTLGLKFDPQVQGFEKVRSGGRHIEDHGQVTNHLSLGNRFNSLAD